MGDERITIILQAIEQSKAALTAAQKQVNDLNATNAKGISTYQKVNKLIGDQSALYFELKIAIAAAAGALVLMVKNGLNQADSLNKQANAIGTTVEKLNGLRLAAELSDISNSDLALGLNELNRSLADAQKKGSNAQRMFQQLGVATKDAAGNIRDPIDVLLDLSEAFSTSEGAAGKAQFAQELFGRSGKTFVTLLNQGGAAIRAQAAEANQLNRITAEMGTQADNVNDNITRLVFAFKGISSAIAAEVAPALVQFSDAIVATVKEQNIAQTVAINVGAALRTIAEIAIYAVGGIQLLGLAIGGGLALAFELITGEARFVINVFNSIIESVSRLLGSMLELVRSLKTVGIVFRFLAAKDFKGAADAAGVAFDVITASALKVSDDFVSIFSNAGRAATQSAETIAASVKGVFDATLDEAGNLAVKTQALLESVKPASADSIRNAPATAAGGSSKALDPNRPTITPLVADTSVAKGFDDFVTGLTGLEDKARLTGAVLTGTIGTAISGLSQGITGLISGTTTWGAVFLQIGQQILSSLIQITLETLVQAGLREAIRGTETASEAAHTATRVGIATAGESSKTGATLFGSIARKAIWLGETIFHGVQVAFQVATFVASQIFMTAVVLAQSAIRIGVILFEAAKYVILAAVQAMSAMASIPYVGPFLAIAALAAVLAAGGAALGAFAEGGVVPGTPSNKDNRLAHVATGELIVSASSTANLRKEHGAGIIGQLLSGRIDGAGFSEGGVVPRPSGAFGFAGGGLVGPPDFDRPREADNLKVNVGFINRRNQERDFMRRDGVSVLVDELERRGNPVVS